MGERCVCVFTDCLIQEPDSLTNGERRCGAIKRTVFDRRCSSSDDANPIQGTDDKERPEATKGEQGIMCVTRVEREKNAQS